ncbi:MAG: hypothetical protein NC395_09020 [Prevotella sp.]|nr:hypothetical protein [Prevotella sp.]
MNLKKIIDEELESMTFNELKNRRSIKMKKNVNFSVKRTAAAVAAVIAAAALLAVSTSAMGLWSISDFINDVFPNRTGAGRETVESYMFEANAETTENSMQYDIAFDNVICDGNILIAQFAVTRSDGGEFDESNVPNIMFNDDLIFPDIHDVNNLEDGSHTGGCHSVLGGDKKTVIVNREYTVLPREVRTGEELYIRFSGLKELTVNPDMLSADLKDLDDGKQVIKFTVPEIAEPTPLEFKNPQGETVFTAKLTPLSMAARVDKPVFAKYDTAEYILYPDELTGYDEQVEWYISNPQNPKFYDENMELTENNPYNGNKYIINSDGNSQQMIPVCEKVCNGDCATIIFGDDPKIDEARYIEWFGCIAEIPQNE